MEKLTFVSGISVPERCHHGLEAAVQRFRLRVKPDKGDIGPDEDGVGDTSAEILLSRGHVSAFFEHVHEVGVALVRSLQFEGIRERQLNLKVVRVSPINATSPDRRVKRLKGFSRDWTRCVSRRGERERECRNYWHSCHGPRISFDRKETVQIKGSKDARQRMSRHRVFSTP